MQGDVDVVQDVVVEYYLVCVVVMFEVFGCWIVYVFYFGDLVVVYYYVDQVWVELCQYEVGYCWQCEYCQCYLYVVCLVVYQQWEVGYQEFKCIVLVCWWCVVQYVVVLLY